MTVTHRIKMDLTGNATTPCLDVMQDDRYSRNLEISLFAGIREFLPPADCTVQIRYRKADGCGGVYDTLPDGMQAWRISGNKVTAALAPQVCTVPGEVQVSVSLLDGDAQLSCFEIRLQVRRCPQGDFESRPYFHVTRFLPQVPDARPGKYLRVADVDDRGRITALETADPEWTGALPEYVTREAKRVAAAVQSHQNADTVTFLACSDLHYSEYVTTAAQQAKTLTHCGQAMGLLRQLLHIDFAAMLGDMVWDSGESAEAALEAMRTVNRHLAAGFSGIPNFRARGNHDCLYSDAVGLTDGQIFANIGAFNGGAEYDAENRLGGYCYRDFPDRKLRIICINTSEDSSGDFRVSAQQISWLESALDLSGLGEGWQSIVLGHHPPDWTGSGNDLVQTLSGAEGVLCIFHGHTHGYKVDTIPNTDIPRIAIPNACFGRENEYGQNGVAENTDGTEFGESTTYYKLGSSALETAFCVVTVDLKRKKIWADHYGAGVDQVLALGEAVNYAVTCNLSKVSGSNTNAAAREGSRYTNELTVAAGYALSSVSVTMGGADITDSAFRSGRISIESVTGDVVITAKAVALTGSFTNLVPTSQDSSGSVFNSTGYQDGAYISTEAPYWKVASDGSVSTGLLAYTVYGTGNTTYYQPPTIYIRGAQFRTTDSHSRLGLFTSAFACATSPYGATLLTYYDVEELGLLYYKLTPKMNAAGQNLMAAAGFKPTIYLALTANGLGRNLIVTLNQPIV